MGDAPLLCGDAVPDQPGDVVEVVEVLVDDVDDGVVVDVSVAVVVVVDGTVVGGAGAEVGTGIVLVVTM